MDGIQHLEIPERCIQRNGHTSVILMRNGAVELSFVTERVRELDILKINGTRR